MTGAIRIKIKGSVKIQSIRVIRVPIIIKLEYCCLFQSKKTSGKSSRITAFRELIIIAQEFMKDFRLFDIYDFLTDDDFIRWVQEARKEDNEFWNDWLAQHPDKHLTIEEARRILQTLAPRKAAVA